MNPRYLTLSTIGILIGLFFFTPISAVDSSESPQDEIKQRDQADLLIAKIFDHRRRVFEVAIQLKSAEDIPKFEQALRVMQSETTALAARLDALSEANDFQKRETLGVIQRMEFTLFRLREEQLDPANRPSREMMDLMQTAFKSFTQSEEVVDLAIERHSKISKTESIHTQKQAEKTLRDGFIASAASDILTSRETG